MVTVRSFKSIRPSTEVVQNLASLPYDVLNSQEARDIAKSNPYSYLHIDKAEINLPLATDEHSDTVYESAAQNLADFQEKGWLVQDDKPALYLYELRMNGISQTGIVATTAIADYQNNKIKKHELTRPEKELDRFKHMTYCDANTSPIFLTYRDNSDISALVSNWKENHPPLYNFESFYSTAHKVWKIDQPEIIKKIEKIFDNQVDSLYIADGHHRSASAVKLGQEKLKNDTLKDDTEANYFLSVIFPKDDLVIYDYNRVISAPLPHDFFDQLSNFFDVKLLNKPLPKPANKREFTMYVEKKWYLLQLLPEITFNNTSDALNAAVFQKLIAENIFNITDIRTDQRIDFIGGIRGLDELETAVNSGKNTVAFALYPTTMDELLTVADNDDIMPPKSTWFEPKLLSGLFVHDLETNR
ncbi:DUF1015 domain-containing protein [Vagococcus vulneris]|uniref:DUF1015 domain-containing protein n=1 Tax=Vagococcus vulneris TaxID=1977869 RepID=A0A430A0I7_9ENTE|nr:DUF1015 family protein [Vagococcus vulneris]RST99847.1 hypothetical protein CBF37_03745 [Vagococcus vulneris]